MTVDLVDEPLPLGSAARVVVSLVVMAIVVVPWAVAISVSGLPWWWFVVALWSGLPLVIGSWALG